MFAVPKSGYLFSHWEDFIKGQKKIHKDGNNTENPRTFIWEEGMTLIAYFTKETTGIEDVSDVNNAVHLYPNPTKTMLTIENATENVQIFDITGRLLINVENKETNLLQINVSHLSKGMYFVKIGNYTTKFVKE